jgi:hypothetical protein
MKTTITSLSEALSACRKNAQAVQQINRTETPEYRNASRREKAAELAVCVLDILEYMKSNNDASHAADAIQRMLANALEQATRDGVYLASNAAQAIKV